MGMNIFTDESPVAKAARRRLYRREWMRKRRAQKGERWQLKAGPRLAALVRSAKPKHISLDQWLRKLIRSGLELQAAMSQPIRMVSILPRCRLPFPCSRSGATIPASAAQASNSNAAAAELPDPVHLIRALLLFHIGSRRIIMPPPGLPIKSTLNCFRVMAFLKY